MKNNIFNIVKSLYPFDYSVVSEGSYLAQKVYMKQLPFKIYKFKAGVSINEWKIPYAKKITQAQILYDGKIIFDGLKEKMSVVSNSCTFVGTVNYSELIKHLYYSDRIKNATPYGWTGLYNHKETWGFCITKDLFLKLNKKGNYQIKFIVNELKDVPMIVYEYNVRGISNKTILINAHNCHPYQANDDISGCSVGISIIKQIKEFKNLNYSYTLLIAPEIYGPLFWLKKIKAKNIIGCIQLKSVGNKNNIKLQKSFNGNTLLDKSFIKIINNYKNSRSYNFREIHGNDEIVFESPGYNIPTITLTRVPFKEYHTNFDTPMIIKNSKLLETKKIVLDSINIIEKNYQLKNKLKGPVCLSSPKYNLYVAPKQPGITKEKLIPRKNIEWNLFMNSLQIKIDQKKTFLDLYFENSFSLDELFDYLKNWEKKGLISLKLKKDLK